MREYADYERSQPAETKRYQRNSTIALETIVEEELEQTEEGIKFNITQ